MGKKKEKVGKGKGRENVKGRERSKNLLGRKLIGRILKERKGKGKGIWGRK